MKKLFLIFALAIILIGVLAITTEAASGWTEKQNKAHEIADMARSMGLPEDDPIIRRASEIWWEEDAYKKAAQEKQKEREAKISREDVEALARTIWGEARGIPSKTEQAAVAWCVLNRVDAGYADSILGVVSAPGQFTGYSSSYPVTTEFAELAMDVLMRWYAEKDGEQNVGRVLPKDYLFFNGSGGRNWFRQEFRSSTYWDWSLPSPY